MITEHYEGFEITLTAEAEDTSPLDLIDLPDKQAEAEYLAKFESGELMWFCAKVAASLDGVELGTSYLGGCDYSSLESFKEDSVYYEDMRAEAVAEAKDWLAKEEQTETLRITQIEPIQTLPARSLTADVNSALRGLAETVDDFKFIDLKYEIVDSNREAIIIYECSIKVK